MPGLLLGRNRDRIIAQCTPDHLADFASQLVAR